MQPKEITAKSAIHYHDRAYTTNWDINTYRGCGHRCIYCFAQYSHKYLDSDKFFDDLSVKINIAEALNTDFLKRSWKKNPVNLCGVTDPYQPLEKQYELMPRIIEIFIKHKNPMIITTKSILLLRDLDLLEELNKVAWVDVRVSASAIDETIRKKIEPNAAPTLERLEMLGKITEKGIYAGVLMMPIIPYLTDYAENLERIFEISKKNGAKSIIPALLHLRGETKQIFYSYISELFPNLLEKIKPLYHGAYVDKNYSEKFFEKIKIIRKKYNFYNEKEKYRCDSAESAQLELF